LEDQSQDNIEIVAYLKRVTDAGLNPNNSALSYFTLPSLLRNIIPTTCLIPDVGLTRDENLSCFCTRVRVDLSHLAMDWDKMRERS
jgi:hypothetical protein